MRYKELTAKDVWTRKKTPEDIALDKARWEQVNDANRERRLSKKLNLKPKAK